MGNQKCKQIKITSVACLSWLNQYLFSFRNVDMPIYSIKGASAVQDLFYCSKNYKWEIQQDKYNRKILNWSSCENGAVNMAKRWILLEYDSTLFVLWVTLKGKASWRDSTYFRAWKRKLDENICFIAWMINLASSVTG